MRRALVCLALAGLAGAAAAMDVSDAGRYVCKQGDCRNGQGMVWDAYLSLTIRGNWSNGNTIPGMTYELVSPMEPTRKFKQVYGADGLLASGQQPRPVGGNGKVAWFDGTYVRLQHPFMRMPLPVIKQGLYDTGFGIEYRGNFEYLPAKSGMSTGIGSGYYIFYGDKIDTEENEKESGLFISDENLAGTPVRWVKADPSYLAVMQQRYQRDMSLATVDFKQQEAEKKWRTALAIIGKVALALAGSSGGVGGGGNGIGGDMAMNLVSSMFNNGGTLDLKDLALQAVGSAVVGDKSLGSTLGKAVLDGYAEANR